MNNVLNTYHTGNSFVHLIIPKLAEEIGLEESIVIHQIHYWLKKCPKIIDNKKWIYNTFDEWHKQFSYWSLSKIKRIFLSLEREGYLLSAKKNSKKYDQTKWYTINYEKLSILLECSDYRDGPDDSRLSQNEPIINKVTKNKTKNKTKTLSLKASDNVNLNTEQNETEREMINIWNEIISEGRGEVQFSNDKTNILKEAKLLFSSDLDLWRDYCKRISSSKFLMGESKGSDFKASIYWASQSINIRKVLDGCFNQGDRIIKSLDLNHPVDEVFITSDPVWREVSNNLQVQLGQATYKSWLSKLKFIKKENQIELQAPNKFIKTWVEDHFKSNINSAFKEIGQGINDVIFSVNPEYVEKHIVK